MLRSAGNKNVVRHKEFFVYRPKISSSWSLRVQRVLCAFSLLARRFFVRRQLYMSGDGRKVKFNIKKRPALCQEIMACASIKVDDAFLI
jgi:hypothetical protein